MKALLPEPDALLTNHRNCLPAYLSQNSFVVKLQSAQLVTHVLYSKAVHMQKQLQSQCRGTRMTRFCIELLMSWITCEFSRWGGCHLQSGSGGVLRYGIARDCIEVHG